MSRRDDVAALLASGESQARIARALGISRQRVAQIMAEHGLIDRLLVARRARVRAETVARHRRMAFKAAQRALGDVKEPPMEASEFLAGLRTLYGDRYRQPAGRAFDVHPKSIDRWIKGEVEVPGPAGRLLEHLLEAERQRVLQRQREQNYRRRRSADARQP